MPKKRIKEGDVMVYDKVEDSNLCLEYLATTQQWQVKSTASKGTNKCCSNCVVPTQCMPFECPAGKWRVYDGIKFESQPAVIVTLLSKEELEVYLEEVKKEAARVVKGTCSVRIKGATGANAAHINGIFET